MTSLPYDPEHDKSALYWLTFIDAVERLETLLLEVRHLQVNMIFLMRSPFLYQFLRFEEQYLWGDHSALLARDHGIDSRSVSALAVPSFPEVGWTREDLEGIFGELDKTWKECHGDTQPHQAKGKNCHGDTQPHEAKGKDGHGDTQPHEAKGRYSKPLDTLRQYTAATLLRIQRIWFSGHWNRNQRSLYLNLCALQALKRNMVRDKLFLCREAFRAFGVGSEASPHNRNLPRFLVLRSVILARARQYVSRIGDHQASFAASFEANLQDHPRPVIGRRRDQHMYSVHLRDRTVDIANEMWHLLDHLGLPPRARGSRVFHRWQHDFSSQSHSFRDEVGPTLGSGSREFHHYINTSYWMPERPDLQSVIAHEVAHGVLRERTDDLALATLDGARDSFTDLLKGIKQVLDHFEVDRYTNIPQLDELAVDLLATATNGSSYLHALFLELLGVRLEEFFVLDEAPGHYELMPPDWLEGHAEDYAQAREWYLRIRVVAAWLKAISDPNEPLVVRHLDACIEIAVELEEHLDRCSPAEYQVGAFWRPLVDELARLVSGSRAARDVRKWRWKCREESKRARPTRIPEFPRSTRFLDPWVRNLVAESMVGNKAEMIGEMAKRNWSDASGGEAFDRMVKQFDTVYRVPLRLQEASGNDPFKNASDPPLCAELFEHLYDIPWQAAMLRGLDLAHQDSTLRPEKVEAALWQLHEHMALGRDLYQTALDFHVHDNEPAGTRLAEAIRLIEELKRHSGPCKPPLRKKLERWMGKNPGDGDQDAPQSKFKTLTADLKQHDATWTAKHHGAWALVAATGHTRPGIPMRALEKAQGHKLEELARLLDRFAAAQALDGPEFRVLRTFLSVSASRTGSNAPANGQRSQTEGFHSRLVRAFSEKKRTSDKQVLHVALGTRMLSRGCVAGHYLNQDQGSTPGGHRSQGDELAQIELDDLKALVKKGRWTSIRPFGCREEKFQILTGRYDFVSLSKARPMCRCALPGFQPGTVGTSFPSFFVRREMVLPLKLGEKSWDDLARRPMLAAISISLDRAGARLAFVYRLLQTLDKQASTGNDQLLASLHGLIGDDFGDRLLLSDGWGDLLLVLGKPDSEPGSKRTLEDIFRVQCILFEDFQVDRTELILTPDCVIEALNQPERFEVTANARLLEDRTLDATNGNFVDLFHRHFRDAYARLGGAHRPRASLCRTPGRMDYTACASRLASDSEERPLRHLALGRKLGRTLFAALWQPHTDRVQTNVTIRRPPASPTNGSDGRDHQPQPPGDARTEASA